MDSFDDDPMYNNVNYSDDEEENSDIAIIEDDNEKDINAKKCSQNIPQCPPDVDTSQCFVYLIPASDSLKPADCNIDALVPWWNKATGSGTTTTYFVEIKDNFIVAAVKAVKGTILKPEHFVMKKYYIKHPVFDGLTKTVFRSETEGGHNLQKGKK